MRIFVVMMDSVILVNLGSNRHIAADAMHDLPVLHGSQVAKEPLEFGHVVNVDTMDSSNETCSRSQAFGHRPLRKV